LTQADFAPGVSSSNSQPLSSDQMPAALGLVPSLLALVASCTAQASSIQLGSCSHGSRCQQKDNVLLQTSHQHRSTLEATVGHSWVVQVGTGLGEGKPRGAKGGDLERQRYFCPRGDLAACQPNPKHNIRLSEDNLRPCRSDVVSDPMARVVAGSDLFVSWMGNGHVNNGQSDGTCVRLMLADFAADPALTAFTELPGGACISYSHSGSKPETSTWIPIPAGTRIGRHTLLWYWNFTDFWYSSCADIEVMAATSLPSSNTTTDAGTTAPLPAVPSGVSQLQVDTYMRAGCDTDQAASTESAADVFCAAYVGPESYCKHWNTDECGRSTCQGGDFLLPCGHTEPEPEPEPEPEAMPSSACGDELCRSTRPGSWCRTENGVCQWTDVPCSCKHSK